MKNLKLVIAALALVLTVALTSPAQNSSGSSTIQLPNGETVSADKIQKIFDRSADVISKLRAEVADLKEKKQIAEEKLSVADETNTLLTEQIKTYEQVIALKTQAIAELQSAVKAKDESIALRDQRIEKDDERIKKLEKNQNSLWKKIKLGVKAAGAGAAVVALILL
jgi:chromosome segregation ATPase